MTRAIRRNVSSRSRNDITGGRLRLTSRAGSETTPAGGCSSVRRRVASCCSVVVSPPKLYVPNRDNGSSNVKFRYSLRDRPPLLGLDSQSRPRGRVRQVPGARARAACAGEGGTNEIQLLVSGPNRSRLAG